MNNNKILISTGIGLGVDAMLAHAVNAPPMLGNRAPVTVAILSENARRRRHITTPSAALADLERRRHNAAVDAKKAAKAARKGAR